MSFHYKYDDNGKLVADAITQIFECDPISCVSELDNFSVTVPVGAYGFRVFRCPVDMRIKINGQPKFYSADEGDAFGTFLNGINSMVISTTGTEPIDPIIIQFYL